jgi:hypothetical protein
MAGGTDGSAARPPAVATEAAGDSSRRQAVGHRVAATGSCVVGRDPCTKQSGGRKTEVRCAKSWFAGTVCKGWACYGPASKSKHSETGVLKIATSRALPPDLTARRGERPAYGRTGTLRIGDNAASEVIVQDLSREGCRIETDAPVTPSMRVLIGLPGVGIVGARVIWHSSKGYGCLFDDPLPPGSITAAFSATNVRRLRHPHPDIGTRLGIEEVVPNDEKWTILARVSFIFFLSALFWGGLVAALLTVLT